MSSHEPHIYTTRLEAWAECCCGWQSPYLSGNASHATLSWMEHFRLVSIPTTEKTVGHSELTVDSA